MKYSDIPFEIIESIRAGACGGCKQESSECNSRDEAGCPAFMATAEAAMEACGIIPEPNGGF